MMVAQQDVPFGHRFVVTASLSCPAVHDLASLTLAPEDVRPGIHRVLQDREDIVVPGRPPSDMSPAWALPKDRHLNVRLSAPDNDLTHAAQFAELPEGEPDRITTRSSGSISILPTSFPAIPGWQRVAELTALGLGVSRREPPLPEQAQLVFGHGPLQSEE